MTKENKGRLSISLYPSCATPFREKKGRLAKSLSLEPSEIPDSFFVLLLIRNSDLDDISRKIKDILSGH